MFHKDNKIILVSLKEKIMDGWGSLTMLIKRQNAEKYRKADLRYELQKRKESYITDKESQDEFDFPQLSRSEMNEIKEDIRKKIRTDKLKSSIRYILAAIAAFLFITYLFMSYLRNEWITIRF